MSAFYDANVNTVLEATKSINACSTSTLRLLRDLLGIQDTGPDVPPGNSSIRSAKTKTKPITAAAKSTRKLSAGINATFTILDCSEEPVRCLPRNKRLMVATNVFNKTLKNLADAVKTKQIPDCKSSGGRRSPLKETQGRIVSVSRSTRKPAALRHPVQAHSPELQVGRERPTQGLISFASLVATAECATTCLQCLRQLRVDNCADRKSDLQLEEGALMLISKLQSLGLIDLATGETLNVRNALELALRRQKKGLEDGTNLDTRLSYGSLVDCIEFADCGDSAKTFGLVTAFHTQVLQLISVDDKSQIEQRLLQTLDPANPQSPCRIVFHGTEQGWISAEKAALQLHSLSQSVLSICSVSKNGVPELPRMRVSPDVQFQLQCLALQMRCHWWRFANHQPNVDREIWAPFYRFMLLLRQKAGHTSRSQFLLVKKCLDGLLDVLSKSQKPTTSGTATVQLSSTVINAIQDMAETTGSTNDLLGLLQDLKGFNIDLSGTQAANNCCRLACASLMDSSSSSQDIVSKTESALNALEMPLKGTTTDLKELLLQASRLRKAAAMRLRTINENSRTTASLTEEHSYLSSICIRAIFSVLHFVIRCVRSKLPGEGNANCTPKSSQRLQSSALVAQQSMNSALAAVQLNITHESVGWELCAAALADCLSVCNILYEDYQDDTNADIKKEGLPTTWVRVSNMFWSWYLKQKEVGACISGLVSILERSIQALERRPQAEKKNGFLDVKCERAAALYMELKRFNCARQVLATAIDAHIEAGTLSVVSQKALGQFHQHVWGEADSSEFMLGRVLSAYARLLLKHEPDPSSSSLFDKAELKPNERALLLHKQFSALGETLVPESLHVPLREIAQTVLSLYGDGAQSLHQLRFIFDLLTLCSKNRLHPHRFLPEEASKRCMEGSSEDAVIWSVARPITSVTILHSCLSLQWAFLTATPSVGLLKAFVRLHTIACESCGDWASILRSFNDPTLPMVQLQSVIDFTDMQGLSQIKLDALLLMRRLLGLQPEEDFSAMASCTTQIALQYTRMGLISQAARALATAETSLAQTRSKALVALQWHLAYAEYFTALTSYEKAADHLVSAQWRYEADFVSDPKHALQGSRIAEHKYLAQAAYVTANIAFENGDLVNAIFQAKKCVKISIRQWTMLEKLLRIKPSSRIEQRTDDESDRIITDMSSMTLSNENQPQDPSGKAAGFWAYVQPHFDCLLYLSRLSDRHGNFQDAVYYAEQAKKIGEATGSDILICRASSFLAAHLAQAANLGESQLMVDSCISRWGAMDHPAISLRTSLTIASAYLANGEFAMGIEAVEQAQKDISSIQAIDQSVSVSRRQNEDPLTSVAAKKATRSATRAAGKARKPRNPDTQPVDSTVHSNAKTFSTDKVEPATGSNTWAQRLQAEVLILKSSLCIRLGLCEDARNLLEAVKPLSLSSSSEAWYSVLQATLMLADALRLLQSDAAYSVLAESPIAYPIRQRKLLSDLPHEETAGDDPLGTAIATPTCSGDRMGNKQESSHSGSHKSRELVGKARELFLSFSCSVPSNSSSALANELSCLVTRMQLLSSVLLSFTCPSSFRMAVPLNAPKSLHWSRELVSIGADIVLADKSTVFAWPETHPFIEAASGWSGSTLDYTSLQQQLNDMLPSSWNIVTIVMGRDESEILTSKIRRGKSPFLLRLPLDRTASEDLDGEPFKFHTAKSELRDIIASANLTAHDAKARSDKLGRKNWWAAREALDERLASLLSDMEKIWLGGFRGILSDQNHNQELLSRFSESLSRILDRHLPSRQKACANTGTKLQLHPHVLELFVALEHPDERDLDDAITDLLYFVVDILQFQGEANAYDEIDFDAIVLEVSDAIRSYHEAAKGVIPESGGHTILILDPALHAFPWESLPCLEGKSVSRMPSLSCLQERLQRMRQKDETSSGLYIDPQKGGFILNPSSDLMSTQETFLEPFNRTLVDYTSIVNRMPSETEFESCLRDKDLCLYFGHGSGAQYIRGRTIKRLKRCAVTFLMGCSSNKMTECGQFEPYGVPYNYLYASSAAVVGTLWDVTDKDIDRFAMKAFVEWGLLDGDTVKEDTKEKARKMKGQGRARKQNRELVKKAEEKRARKQQVGLDEAVAKARDGCLLRYLNGAAPVIYGIPIYLEQ